MVLNRFSGSGMQQQPQYFSVNCTSYTHPHFMIYLLFTGYALIMITLSAISQASMYFRISYQNLLMTTVTSSTSNGKNVGQCGYCAGQTKFSVQQKPVCCSSVYFGWELVFRSRCRRASVETAEISSQMIQLNVFQV